MENHVMEERLAALEERIRELEGAPRRAMKDSLRCPMCGGRTIYRSTADVSDHVLMNLSSTKGVFSYATVPCGAHACASCGFTELHANLTDINLEKTHLEVLQGEDPEDSASPYR